MKKRSLRFLKSLSKENCIIFSIMVVLTTLIMDPMIVKICALVNRGEYLPKTMGQLIPGILILLIARFVLPNQEIGFRAKGFLPGIGLGWIFVIYSIYNLNIPYVLENGVFLPELSTAVGLILYSLSIGFCEEIMMRGLILNSFISKWGNTKKGIYKSVILSSLIFGVAHIVNLFYTSDLVIATIAQMFYAISIGIFLAGIYLRSKNIWAVIFLHALFDFASYFSSVFSTATEGVVDITIANAIAVNILLLPLAFIGLFLIRKVKLDCPKNIDNSIL